MKNPLKNDSIAQDQLGKMFGAHIAKQLIEKDVYKTTSFEKMPTNGITYSEKRYHNTDGTVIVIPNN